MMMNTPLWKFFEKVDLLMVGVWATWVGIMFLGRTWFDTVIAGVWVVTLASALWLSLTTRRRLAAVKALLEQAEAGGAEWRTVFARGGKE